jgi:RNA polymerase sigma-70 factor (ECF subfamily)
MPEEPGQITLLLREWRAGNREAEKKLFELLEPELRKMARRLFRGERRSHTLQPTAVLNELYLRLTKTKKLELRDRRHFFAIAGRVMRHILIDYVHGRPDFQFVSIEGFPKGLGRKSQVDLAITIDRLLEDLEKEDPLKRTIVELKFFLGLTEEESASGSFVRGPRVLRMSQVE